MRFAIACVAFLVVALPAAARTDPSVVAPTLVAVLAADGERGQRIAFLSLAANGCGTVGLWKPGEPVRRLGPVPCGPRTSTGRGAYGLSFGGVLLWATYTGGNFREHTLWRSVRQRETTRFGPARAIAGVTHDVSESSPLLIGEGDEPWAAYAVGSTAYTVSAERRRSLPLASRPLGLIVHGPYVSVRSADGPVSVYLAEEKDEIAQFDYARGEVLALKAHGTHVAVLRRGALDVQHVYRPEPATIRLPAARSYGDDHCGADHCQVAELRLADLQGPLAVYVHGRAIHVLRWTDQRDIVIRRPAAGPVHAELEATGLSYSAGRRVFFIPRSEIDRRLRSG
jgi:hypothetical protein